MLSDGSFATVFEARPATKPGICAFLEMDEAASAGPKPEDALGVDQEPEPALEATPEPGPEVSPEQVSETAPETEPDIEPESELEPEPAPEPAPEPSAKEQEKLRIAREVKAARDKMELLDKVRGKLLNRLLVMRRESQDLSNQSGSNQLKELSAQVDWLDDQLRDARLAYAKTSHASIQALKELGQ